MHLKQPKTSKTCGQHCLAMLAGVPLAKVIDLLGRKGTTPAQVLAAAAKHRDEWHRHVVDGVQPYPSLDKLKSQG